MFNFLNQNRRKLIKSNNPIKFTKKTLYEKKEDFFTKDYKQELLDINTKSSLTFSVYWNVKQKSDILLLSFSNIKSNIFTIYPNKLGREYSKTTTFKTTYKEESKRNIIQILHGEGYILLESIEEYKQKVIKIIKIKNNNIVLIPKNYTFTIINTSNNENLICINFMGKRTNLIPNTLKNQYGNTIYCTINGFIKNNNSNPNYKLEEYQGNYIEDLNFTNTKNLYEEFIKFPEKFNFLK
jgi:oxalate decarboxylase/phosphoglucose isomerase-like protein (cupin superfamily)